MINLGKTSYLNYHFKTYVAIATIWENFQICARTLDELASRKKNHRHANNMSFMNNTLSLSMAHMMRTRLRNRFLKNKSTANKTAYLKQHNYCTSVP